MRRTMLSAFLVMGAMACTHHEDAFKLLKAPELQALQASASPAHLFDANTPDFRAKNGIIPGAQLLDSAEEYDVAKTLPADKGAPLVFYCTSPH